MMKVKSYVTPGANDVLCGRGPTSFRHPGNHALRGKIADNLEKYVRCTSRKAKTLLIHEIILSVMQEGGKFLHYDKQAQQWFDGGLDAAKNRVGSAFWDASVPGKVKCIEDLRVSSQRKRSFNCMISSSQSGSASSNQILHCNKATERSPCAEAHPLPLVRQVASCPASLLSLHMAALQSPCRDPIDEDDGADGGVLDLLGEEYPEDDYYPIAIFVPTRNQQ